MRVRVVWGRKRRVRARCSCMAVSTAAVCCRGGEERLLVSARAACTNPLHCTWPLLHGGRSSFQVRAGRGSLQLRCAEAGMVQCSTVVTLLLGEDKAASTTSTAPLPHPTPPNPLCPHNRHVHMTTTKPHEPCSRR